MGGTVNATDLITDLARLGIRIEAHGDRLRYSPRSAVTPDLTRRMKAHKGELLAILRGDTPEASADTALHAAVADDPETYDAGESIEVIDPPDPCPKCGTLELWQTLAGNWRCLRCDPPTKARRLRQQLSRFAFLVEEN